MYRRLPNSMSAVIRTLTTARDTYKLTTTPLDRAIDAETFAKLDDASPTSLLSRLIKEAADVDLALAAQAPFTSALSLEAAHLTMYVSHFHQVLDLGILRGDFLPGDRPYYGRDITATTVPALATYDAVEEAAAAIVKGEADRQAAATAAGKPFTPMTLPSAAQVATVLAAFKEARDKSQLAQTKTETEREEAQTIYTEAQALAVDICDTVEFFYRKDPEPASRRSKCRRWGVVYITEPGETPDPGTEGTVIQNAPITPIN
jgi:hypothetical protein